MNLNFIFFFNSALLGVGLAMDAFTASLANGMSEPCMRKKRMVGIAGVFAFFQAAMPMIGWFCIHTIVQYFNAFEKCIPWIALALLSYIGVKMILDKPDCAETGTCTTCKMSTILLQGVATSIDALSVGFTIEQYNFPEALLAAFIIAVVTFFICFAGIALGKKAGTKLAGKANLFGGLILIFIGLEIFITSFF